MGFLLKEPWPRRREERPGPGPVQGLPHQELRGITSWGIAARDVVCPVSGVFVGDERSQCYCLFVAL